MYDVNVPICEIIWVKMAAVLFMLAPTFGEFTRLFLDRVLGNISIIEARFCARVHLWMCAYVCGCAEVLSETRERERESV